MIATLPLSSICALSEITVQSRAKANINGMRYDNLGRSKDSVDHITSQKQEVTFPWGGTGTLSEALGGLAWHKKEHVETIQRWQQEL